jgi:MoxR-like ATPase
MSDPDAIRAAARECDELGEEAFLKKYGFGRTQYVAILDGKRYPGKALVAAAHGIEFPDEGLIASGDTSGGVGGTNRVLRRLGFEVMKVGEDDMASATKPRVWIEVTRTNRPDRKEGPYKVGAALWSPKTGATGGDLYKEMREAKPGDWVLHLTDVKAIVGRSRVANAVEDMSKPPPNTDWSDREGQLVRLKDFEALDPALSREVFFKPPFGPRLKQLKSDGLTKVFFTRDLELAQGHYFTAVPEPVLEVLRDAYYEISGIELIPGYVYTEDGGEMLANGDGEVMVPDELSSWTNLSKQQLTELIELLQEKRQLILYGPPGSGKTFVADALARYLSGNPIDPKNGELNDRYELVQFHQSYGYEDFIQGIRPNVAGESLSYKVQDGILKILRDRASQAEGEIHVMLIDEINRGNLSRIFGELLLLLEYRGQDKQVRLPYESPDKPRFTLPQNLYFIGTMNTADRSLAQIDYALRRRFFFYRLSPVIDEKAPILERWLRTQDPAIPEPSIAEALQLFVALNDAVTRELGEDFQIGHSYFMNRQVTSPAGRDRIWRTAIEPLLDEYFHNRKNRAQLIEDMRPEALLAPTPPAPIGAIPPEGDEE